MSEEEKKESAPTPSSGDSTAETPPTPSSGDSTAENYIDEQLVKSRKNLQVTRIVMVVLAVVMFGYLSWLKWMLSDYYEPKGAAETALGLVLPQIETYTEKILNRLKTVNSVKALPVSIHRTSPRLSPVSRPNFSANWLTDLGFI